MPENRLTTLESASLPQTLRQYALLADGERGVLVGPRGDFCWMCFPRWDSPSVFSTLMGGDGCYVVAPSDRSVWGGYYEDGSLIWRSRWVLTDAIVECREALVMPAEPDKATLLRRIEIVEGRARLDVLLRPRADYDQSSMTSLSQGPTETSEPGTWHARTGDVHLRWSGVPEAERIQHGSKGSHLAASFALSKGERRDIVLELSESPTSGNPPVPDEAWVATEAAWHADVPTFDHIVARRDARHSYAVLWGLTSKDGGTVAAATTSLPERADQGRSYDYRYVWIRDQSYVGQAVAAIGPYPLLDRAVEMVSRKLLEDGERLVPAYGTDGQPVPDLHTLPLPGYPGGTDVAGNLVRGQFQLDAFGESLLLFAAAARHAPLAPRHWQAAQVAVGVIERRWKDPDAGIWELEDRRWTHSRLACVAGLKAIASVCDSVEQASGWLALADVILADTSQRCLHPSGRWQRAEDDDRVDASLLIAAVRGALGPDDPRTKATLRAVHDELAADGFVYRFRPDLRPLGSAEGAFVLCGFGMAMAAQQHGDAIAAARWFERNRAACGPPGLFTEEYDIVERQLRGNLPQAFVHAMFLECAAAISSDPPTARSLGENQDHPTDA